VFPTSTGGSGPVIAGDIAIPFKGGTRLFAYCKKLSGGMELCWSLGNAAINMAIRANTKGGLPASVPPQLAVLSQHCPCCPDYRLCGYWVLQWRQLTHDRKQRHHRLEGLLTSCVLAAEPVLSGSEQSRERIR
jgi:hypothetical protein